MYSTMYITMYITMYPYLYTVTLYFVPNPQYKNGDLMFGLNYFRNKVNNFFISTDYR